jgi:DNA polymerase-3 subunit beta
LLLDVLKSLPEQPLTFSLENNILEINSNNGKYALSYMNGDEFPKSVVLEDASEIDFDSQVLLNIINSTIFASGNDDLRPVMSGVFFQISPEGSCFVATDAHKLVKYVRNDINSETSIEFIVPNKPLNILKSIVPEKKSEVKVLFNNTNAIFKFSTFKLTCRLIDGKFPNYEAVIPKENPNVLEIDRTQLLSSTKRASIFSSKTTNQVKFEIKGNLLQITAEDLDFNNKAEETLECNYNGDDIAIGFNSRFIVEMLNNLSSDLVKIELSSPNRAGLISPVHQSNEKEDITMLVMPIMLN